MLRGTRYDNGETVFLLSIDAAARRGPLTCVTNNVNPQCCMGEHNNNTEINDGSGIGEWSYNDTLVKTLISSGSSSVFRNRSLQQVHLNVKNGMILPAGIYRCVVPDTTGQNVSATITLTNGESQSLSCLHTYTYMHMSESCTCRGSYIHNCLLQCPYLQHSYWWWYW